MFGIGRGRAVGGQEAEALLADRLVGELSGIKRNPLVILREGGRWVQRFEPLMLDPAPSDRTWLRPGGVYLVTGGLGGIGLEVMEHLARHAKARLVSVGRSSDASGIGPGIAGSRNMRQEDGTSRRD